MTRFRWVACQLDFLGDCLSDKQCRDALERLPPGLDESYMRVLQRVPIGKEQIVQMILNCIAYAEPRLDIPMTREVLSVPENVSRGDTLDPRSIIREESIMRLCRSLVRKSNDGNFYEFAHFSVQEFLEGKMSSIPELKVFQVSRGICQLLLAKQCLKYLLFQNFSYLPKETSELQEHLRIKIDQCPFYFYAAIHWPFFARSHWTDETLIELAKVLFQPRKTGNFISWALEFTSLVRYQCRGREQKRLYILRHPGLRGEYFAGALYLSPRLFDNRFTTLHTAAVLSLRIICSGLIAQGADIDKRSSFGSPLQCAVQGMFLASAKLHASHSVCPFF